MSRPTWPARRLPALLGALALAAGGCAPAGGHDVADPLVVAAASHLRPVVAQVADDHQRATGRPVTVVHGSSGSLAGQIVEGAPVDLLLAADADSVDVVIDAGRARPGTRATFAYGRLALWTSGHDGPAWDDLADLAGPDGPDRVAIANPDHAPYGRAAVRALRAAGVLDDLDGRLVHAQSAGDAQRMASAGAVDAVVGAASLAVAAESHGARAPVPERLHGPMPHDLVVVADDDRRAEEAAGLADRLTRPDGRALLRRWGLEPAGSR